MKKVLIGLIVLIIGTAAFASEDVRIRLGNNYPEFKTLDEMNPTPVAGLYEARQGNIVFYTDGETVIFGHMFNTARKNLTQERLDAVAQKQLDSLDLSKAIKIGKGKKKVIEFTDVDCPFCRKSEEYFKDNDTNITRYIFFFPLQDLHPDAKAKSEHILCAKNPAEEYFSIIKGNTPAKLATCKKGQDALTVHMKMAETMLIQGTPAFWIDGVRIDGADPRIAEMIK